MADIQTIEKALIMGDLSRLTEQERLSYYQKVCESLGLNPLTKPFDYIDMEGKLTLYATKSCTEQLRNLNSISLQIKSREKIGDVYVVTATAKMKDGREDESTGAVALKTRRRNKKTNEWFDLILAGDDLANAYMKAETKAKRRVTLSICGLAMLDESELDSVQHEPVKSQERSVTNQIQLPPKQIPNHAPQSKVYMIPSGPHKGLTIEQLVKKLGNGNKTFEYVSELAQMAPTNKQVMELYDKTMGYLNGQAKWSQESPDEEMPPYVDDPPAALMEDL